MIKKFLKFIDGKKTIIGFTLVSTSQIIPDPTIKGILWVLGTVIGGTGAIHKYRKGELKK